jgi:hypothetical protein
LYNKPKAAVHPGQKLTGPKEEEEEEEEECAASYIQTSNTVLNSGWTVSLCLSCAVYMKPTVYWFVPAQGHSPHYIEIHISCFNI